MVSTSRFSIIESYTAPCEMVFNENIIKSGTWLVKLQFHDDEIWEAVMNEEFSGVSIGATATVEYIDSE
jgi:hypothetical protein